MLKNILRDLQCTLQTLKKKAGRVVYERQEESRESRMENINTFRGQVRVLSYLQKKVMRHDQKSQFFEWIGLARTRNSTSLFEPEGRPGQKKGTSVNKPLSICFFFAARIRKSLF